MKIKKNQKSLEIKIIKLKIKKNDRYKKKIRVRTTVKKGMNLLWIRLILLSGIFFRSYHPPTIAQLAWKLIQLHSSWCHIVLHWKCYENPFWDGFWLFVDMLSFRKIGRLTFNFPKILKFSWPLASPLLARVCAKTI